MPRHSNRLGVLNAAAELVRTHGLAKLTLDSAAAAAKVSKGGLLYHFPTKVALLAALADHLLDSWDQQIAARADANPGRAAWARAYVDATFDDDSYRPDAADTALLMSQAGADILAACTARFTQWEQHMVADGLTASTAALVRFACDGWWTYAAAAGPGTQAQDSAVLRARLHALINEEVNP